MSLRVYLTDDSPETIEVLTTLYSCHPSFEVVGHSMNTVDALEVLRTEATHIDVVSLDIQLGSEDGIELCARITSEFPHLFVVMCSIESHGYNRRRAQQAGASHFMSKPFGFREMDELVALVGRRASTDTVRVAEGEGEATTAQPSQTDEFDMEVQSLLTIFNE